MIATTALLLLLAGAESAPPGCRTLDLSIGGLSSLEAELARAAGLTGAAPPRPGLLRRASGARPLPLCPAGVPAGAEPPDPAPQASAAWDLVPTTWFSTYHHDWSDDRNDGALFGGKGLSTQLSTGLRLRWWRLTAQLAPSVAWQQNLAFAIRGAPPAGGSPYANPFNPGVLDLPLRMGPRAFWTLDSGQSYLRLDLGPFAAGFSTENLWWGPGVRNSLLFNDSAPGFPHLFLGTTRPVDVWIGALEIEALWGQLRDSRWLHADRHVERRLISATALTFAPAFQPHLTLGMGRAWIFPDFSIGLDRVYSTLLPPVLQIADLSYRSTGSDNQLSVLFFRWTFPEVQLGIHGEWGRDDWPAGLLAFVQEPGYSQAFGFGLEKLFAWRHGWLRFQAELTHTFEMPPANAAHQTATFYTHDGGTSFTHAGQMLGAGVGPQADTQFVAVDWFHARGRLGLYVERIIRNERWFYEVAIVPEPYGVRHDLAMSYGARGTWSSGPWELSADVAITHRNNASFAGGRGGPDARLTVRYWPGRVEEAGLPPPAPPAEGR